MIDHEAIVNRPIAREPNGDILRDVLKKKFTSLFTAENLKWLGFLFLFVNLGIFGVHRLVVKKYITAALIFVSTSTFLVLYLLTISKESSVYEVMFFLGIAAAGLVGFYYVVDLWRIFRGDFDNQEGEEVYKRSLPGDFLLGLALVVLFNIQLLALVFLVLPMGTLYQ